MARMAKLLTAPAACLALATACSDGTGPDRSTAERSQSGDSTIRADSLTILVDASRDGGVWWFPQAGPFDPAADHQGLALTAYLRGKGYRVAELGRPTTITAALLEGYAIVIRAGEFGGYTAGEILSYRRYVAEGGHLLLLADHMRYAPPDDLAGSFGLVFAGITRGTNILEPVGGHPVTDGLGALDYGIGSALVAAPDSAVILGRLDAWTYVDLDDDEVQDAGEPSAPAVLGAMAFGAGRIVFCGDTNLWAWYISRPLVDNVLAWFGAGH